MVDTGPPYPLPPPPTGIGTGFAPGVSPIGTPPPFNYWLTVLSQYANSPILTKLVSNFFQYLDQTANFDEFFDLIWNVDTAEGYGLDVWGRIVGVTRVLTVASGPKFFGFGEAGTISADPFGQSPFFSGQGQLTSSFSLSDDAFRTLILAKALSNISDGSIPSINALLRSLFTGRGDVFVLDNNNMTLTYRFHFILSSVELAIVSQSGVLPKPTGVQAQIVTGF